MISHHNANPPMALKRIPLLRIGVEVAANNIRLVFIIATIRIRLNNYDNGKSNTKKKQKQLLKTFGINELKFYRKLSSI